MQIASNGITLEVERFGSARDPAVVLVMGLGMQLVAWPDALVHALVARGLQVIRFDNRDAGLSTQFDHLRAPLGRALLRYTFGLPVSAPYQLDDMAADAVGVLDALGIARAHWVGASMGGMIAQLIAIHHAPRVASLTSIMSTTGDRRLPRARWDAALTLTRRPPAGSTVEQLVDHYVQAFRVIGSPGFPLPDAELRSALRRSFARAWRPHGTARQMLAIMAAADRTAALGAVCVPTLVLHGADDPLVPRAHADATARAIPDARLIVIDGMGHDLGPLPQIEQAVGEHVMSASDRALRIAE